MLQSLVYMFSKKKQSARISFGILADCFIFVRNNPRTLFYLKFIAKFKSAEETLNIHALLSCNLKFLYAEIAVVQCDVERLLSVGTNRADRSALAYQFLGCEEFHNQFFTIWGNWEAQIQH